MAWTGHFEGESVSEALAQFWLDTRSDDSSGLSGDLTDLCPCGETKTTFHIVKSCPLTKLNGGLSRLHSADEDTVLWLTSYGS